MDSKNKLGFLHIYCGEGKGKTTAAMGLAVRALGNDLKVIIVQFLKNGRSGEIQVLEQTGKIKFFANPDIKGFSFNMNDIEKNKCRENHIDIFEKATNLCLTNECDILILDEIIGAIERNLFDEKVLLKWLQERSEKIEVILTGRYPSNELIQIADYVSRIEKIKHPFDKGMYARYGIEK